MAEDKHGALRKELRSLEKRVERAEKRLKEMKQAHRDVKGFLETVEEG